MGMLMHNTLMELEKANSGKREVEKPVENPIEENDSNEPVKKTGGRRKKN